ncbi:hypothetical protein [Enterococcus sp. HY326]|uniref:hypothetical protein n=1 Tax=Enterococcus sp. HY326 TaxID=2971265 RepID=UPI00223F04C4|nr:hypothetical protein [Enterococcus sp. HY326]
MKKIVEHMRKNEIVFSGGLSDLALAELEKIYHISFPEVLKVFYQLGVPRQAGFIQWQDTSRENREIIEELIARPELLTRRIITNYPDEIIWNQRAWGSQPETLLEQQQILYQQLERAPKLLPFYGNFYLPESSEENLPVIQVAGGEISIKENFADFLEIHFTHSKELSEKGKRKATEVTFWSDFRLKAETEES